MKITFLALIEQMKVKKNFLSGDQSVRITLKFDSLAPDLMDGLKRLHRADSMVKVTIEEE